MKKITQLSLILLTFSLLFSCAKQRPIKDIPDPDQKRYKKQDFLSENGKEAFWYHQVTVIGGSQNRIGPQTSDKLKVGFFKFQENEIQFLDAQTDLNPGKASRSDVFIGGKDREGKQCEKKGVRNPVNEVCYDTKNKLVISWPITHSEYRLAETDGKVSNIEEENRYIKWYKKAFFKINWNTHSANTLNKTYYMKKLQCAPFSSSLKQLTVEKDYMDFEVNHKYSCAHGMQDLLVKYSFKRYKKSTYEPYYYRKDTYDPLNEKYGYFQNRFEYYNVAHHQRQLAIQAGRLDPEKEHNFYLSSNFPEDYKKIVKAIFQTTNDFFKEHELKIRINLNTEKQVRSGDLRYHVIEYVGDKGGGGAVAYGVSNMDPFTGEIVSGNIRLFLRPERLDFLINKYLKTLITEKKKLNSGEFYERVSLVVRKNPDYWDSSGEKLKSSFYYQNALPFYTQSVFNLFTQPSPFGTNPVKENMINYLSQLKDLTKKMDHMMPAGNIKKQINKQSKSLNIIEKALEHDHDQHDHSSCDFSVDKAMSLFNMLAGSQDTFDGKAIKKILVYFLIKHELGHILGLRHNFMGSVDRKNFHNPDSKYGSSSIMDYVSLYTEYEMNKSGEKWDWGKYDKAALAYLYSNGKIDLSKKNGTYLYCSDEHTPLSFFCNRFDYGTTPSEIVKSMIENYNIRYEIINKPWGRQFFTGNIFDYINGLIWALLPVKQILQLYYQEKNMDLSVIPRITEKYSGKPGQLQKEVNYFKEDISEAVKLSLAFFNGIIHHSLERPMGSSIGDFSGQTVSIGTFFDRLFSMILLLGDENMFNLNIESGRSSYLTYLDLVNHPTLGETVDNIFNQSLIGRDLTTFNPFIFLFSQMLYAGSASSIYLQQHKLIDNVKVQCFTKKGLENALGIKSKDLKEKVSFVPWNYTDHKNKNTLESYKDFKGNLAIFKYKNQYYVSDQTNKYAFQYLKLIQQRSGDPLLRNLYEFSIPWMFKVYNVTHSIDDTCYDGAQ